MELVITEKKALPTLCLNMIVKNESKIITRLLESVCKIIDTYCICDTGSTDNTVFLIEKFFEKKNINGKIYHDIWKDFGYNRSLALKHASQESSDYIFIFDADDTIEGNIDLSNLVLDCYMLKFDNGSYERMCLVKNDGTWYYRGVLHEYICSKSEKIPTKGSISGDYYIISGRTSFRNLDPDKYLKDARILEKC